MRKPPTIENRSHGPGHAPGELEIIGSHMLEAVPVYESTERLLIALAAAATEHAQRHPDDESAAQVAKIVTAIEIAHEAGDPDFVKKLAAKADHYLRYDFIPRPATRDEQADMLCTAVAHGLQWDWTAGQIAERFVMRLRISPDIAKHTCVRVEAGGWRGTDAEAEAVFAVESAIAEKLETADAIAITKAALRALGCPDETVQNFFRT